MHHADVCYDNVAWSEPSEVPTREISRFNESCPQEGEIRSVIIGHSDEVEVGGKVWLLYQSGLSLANGFPEPEEEIENAAVVQVEFLACAPVPKKATCWSQVEHWAQVRCLAVVPLREIARKFHPAEPVAWPLEGATISFSQTKSLFFVSFHTQEITEWLLLTNELSPRLIMTCQSLVDEPFEICNCPFDLNKWRHQIYEPRHQRREN